MFFFRPNKPRNKCSKENWKAGWKKSQASSRPTLSNEEKKHAGKTQEKHVSNVQGFLPRNILNNQAKFHFYFPRLNTSSDQEFGRFWEQGIFHAMMVGCAWSITKALVKCWIMLDHNGSKNHSRVMSFDLQIWWNLPLYYATITMFLYVLTCCHIWPQM